MRKDKQSNLKMELFTQASGGEVLDMDMVCKFGLMVQSIRGIGTMARQLAKENSYMWMEISMMVIGRMTKLVDMEFTFTIMVLDTKVIGLMITSMGME